MGELVFLQTMSTNRWLAFDADLPEWRLCTEPWRLHYNATASGPKFSNFAFFKRVPRFLSFELCFYTLRKMCRSLPGKNSIA